MPAVLLNTLEELGRHDQVIFTTHSSEFVNRAPLGNVLTVQRCDCDNRAPAASRGEFGGLRADDLAKVQRYLQEDRSDMLLRAALLVEGQAELFALPNFARTLGLDLDGNGVSVVFVNGLGNFYTYHHILRLQHPHVILVDGDGKPRASAGIPRGGGCGLRAAAGFRAGLGGCALASGCSS